MASSLSFPENEAILDGLDNCLMPATPILQKHCFFKKCPKNVTNFGKFKIFFEFLVSILYGFSMIYRLFLYSQYFFMYKAICVWQKQALCTFLLGTVFVDFLTPKTFPYYGNSGYGVFIS